MDRNAHFGISACRPIRCYLRCNKRFQSPPILISDREHGLRDYARPLWQRLGPYNLPTLMWTTCHSLIIWCRLATCGFRSFSAVLAAFSHATCFCVVGIQCQWASDTPSANLTE